MHDKKQAHIFPWLIVLYEIMIYLSMDAYAPAFPDIAKNFNASMLAVQWTATIWMLGGLLVQLVFGPLSDRFGRRPILLGGGVLYVLSSLVCALAPSMPVLLIARLAQGIAMPSMFIAGYAAVNEYFPTESAIKIMARMNSVTILAPAFGPILGGALLLVVSWRVIFLLLAVMSLLSIIALYFLLPETLNQENKSQRLHVGSICRQYLNVFTNINFMRYCLMAFLPVIGIIAWMLIGPFLVVEKFHHSALAFGFLQALIFSCFMLGTTIAGKFSHEKHHRMFINSSFVFLCIGSGFALLFAHIFPQALSGLVASIMLINLGVGMMIPLLSRLCLDTSDQPMGIKVTVFSTVRIGSGFLGAICLPLFYNGSLWSVSLNISVFVFLALILRIWQEIVAAK